MGPWNRAWKKPSSCKSKSLASILQAESPQGPLSAFRSAPTSWQDWEEVFVVNWERCQGWGVPKCRLCLPRAEAPVLCPGGDGTEEG